MSIIDLIKSKVKLSDVVGQRVKLTKRGNNIIGLCPFHNEKTPSFTVSDEKGLYYCFGCGASGDVIQFTCDINALDFKGAVSYLAEMYGIDVPQHTDNQIGLIRLLNEATIWFEKQLYSNSFALEYVKNRRITDNTIKKFRLGYAPAHGLVKYLLSCGFNIDDIRKTGLSNVNDQDYFYNRIMFPICNSVGDVIGFGGRSIINTQNPKYLNSKASVFFQKRESLYAAHIAVREARKAGKIIVVEGYMDALILHQLGIGNVVALLGTSMTSEHLTYLWDISTEVIVWMDGDVAGKMACVKAASLALSLIKSGCIIKFVNLDTCDDPYDICINKGITDVMAILDNAKLLSEFIWDYELSKVTSGSAIMPEQCVMLDARMKYYISKINDSNIAKYYKKYFYNQVRNLQQYSNSKSQIFDSNGLVKKLVVNQFNSMTTESFSKEYNQLRAINIIMEFPELLDNPIIFDQFTKFHISDNSLYELQQHILNIKIALCDSVMSKNVLFLELQKAGLSHLIDYVFKKMVGFKYNTTLSHDKKNDHLAISKKEIEKIMLVEQLRYLQEEILDLRLSGKDSLAEKLSHQAQAIDTRLRELWDY
ncbi:DNA primase [Ehrlichia ruminantium]|uniref:DNA primase n=1 Tax=Ehrlichia ruminantium TaxID=779 RepID=UPI0015DC59C9|nr:DNA primase [Ehrlichia ruminantium]QLK50407.1 DNA primase [Ehrlichia ruminantium]QLK51331.1 DNA primase [Ehrlichia ruminantium]QLK53167.1 DNA primase [Ehrlichia ruminantium]QLK58669.1 DNA primase [Ehrlichia ruminantium]UOD99110.1 DNA primase [Ehrlichia ruminantium]